MDGDEASDLNGREEEEEEDRELFSSIGCSDAQQTEEQLPAKSEDQTPTKKPKASQVDPSSSEMLMMSSSSSSCAHSSKAKCSVGTVTCSVGVTTDPDCLGPCDPGTSVILEGIVWSESNNGILVVNVTWRGKTYVGTLMDATKHHWASPRFREESPTADLEYRAPKSKRGTPVTDVTDRTDRRRPRKCRRTTAAAAAGAWTGGAGGRTAAAAAAPAPPRQSPPMAAAAEANSGRICTRGGRGTDSEADAVAAKRARVEPAEEEDAADPVYYKCMAPDCRKKFKHISGLRYHQSQAHKKQSSTALGLRRTECPPPPPPPAPPPPDAISMEKGRIERRKEEEEEEEEPSEKLLPGAGAVFPTLGYEVAADVITDCNSETTMSKTVADETIPVDEAKVEAVGLLTASCSGDPVTTAAPEETVESERITEPVNESTRRPSTVDEVLREETMRSGECVPVCPKVMTPDFQNAAKQVRMDSMNTAKAFDSKKTPNNTMAHETDANQQDRDLIIRSPSTSADLFPKPLLRTADVGRHKTTTLQPSEKHLSGGGAQTASAVPSCPPNVGPFRLLPGAAAAANGEDKRRSPVYSDISDANDGSSNENELRLRRGGGGGGQEKDSRRIPPRTEKLFAAKHDDSLQSKPNARLSPFPSPAQNSSCLPSNRKSVDAVRQRGGPESEQTRKAPGLTPPAKTPAVSLAKPSAPPPPPPPPPQVDRCRSDRGAAGAVDFGADALKAQESGLVWIEMLQRANMMPFGYGVDPVVHMQLMTSNADYRNHYERWYMGQQCYRQMLQAEKDKCDKPVDMSAKPNAASGAANNSSVADSKTSASFKLHSKPIGNFAEEQHMSEKHRNSVAMTTACNYASTRSVTHGHHHHHHHHHEKNAVPRSKPLVPKQESMLLLQGTTDRDEKPLDLINPQGSNVNRVKSTSKQLEPPVFSSGSSNQAVLKSKGGGVGQLQDFPPKASLAAAQVPRYEGSFPSHFSGFHPGSSYLDSSLVTSGNRYPVLSGKYPPTGNERPAATTPSSSSSSSYSSSSTTTTGQQPPKKTDPSTTPLHSAKDHLLLLCPPAEKNGDAARRQNADGFEFAADNSATSPDKAPAAPGHNSPLTLRHLHTHHHTHVVGAAPYSLYGSYSGLMSPVPTIVPSVVPVIPPTYIPK